MAKTFTDAEEREWEIPVNVASVRRCRELNKST